MTGSLLPIVAPRKTPIIVGGGNAGLAAAARFAHHGVPVILLEKQESLGGQLLLSGGAFSAAGTKRQRDLGISDDAALHASEVIRIGHGLGARVLIELATFHAATAVDWLDHLGFRFAPETPAIVLGHEPYSVPRTYWGSHEENGARAILDALLPAIQESSVQVRVDHRAIEIMTDDAGAVSGVRCATPGAEVVIDTDCVILATGGYAASREVLHDLQPGHDMALLGCLPHATGDALALMERFGVEILGAEHFLPTMGMIEDPDAPGVALRLNDARVIVDANARMPWEIWVNDRGERFVDESTPSPDHRERALLEQPNLAFWSIWTEETLTRAAMTPIGPWWTADRVRAASGEVGWLWKADTLDELCTMTGLPLPALRDTVDAYNSAESDAFGRRAPAALTHGPYYAVRSVGAMLLSRGGPRVDEQLRPIGRNGDPVRGLHLIGEVLGMSQFSGDAFAGGMSVGPALTFGALIADSIVGAMGSDQ